jgi:hypothetical protein
MPERPKMILPATLNRKAARLFLYHSWRAVLGHEASLEGRVIRVFPKRERRRYLDAATFSGWRCEQGCVAKMTS